MGKAEAAKNMAEESSEKNIDHIKALMGIAQAGKLNQIESLVTRVTAWSEEIDAMRYAAMDTLRAAQNAAKRVEETTAKEVRKANEELLETLKKANAVTRRLEEVAQRPAWVSYLIVALYSMLGAAVMAGVLYFKLPNYHYIVSHQALIYEAIQNLKVTKTKPQGMK